jgi:hypothetical protein
MCACGCGTILTVGQIQACHKCGTLSRDTPANQVTLHCRAQSRHCHPCQTIAAVEVPNKVDEIVVANPKGKPKTVKLAKTTVVALPDKVALHVEYDNVPVPVQTEVALPVEYDNVPVPIQNGAMASDVANPVQGNIKKKRGKMLILP